ncbi:MAG TPA: hypothetical protein VM913_07290 [Sphingomicrobium sp.]|jgi:hypothetical protein|nr:hypothetical protein [Sphingomicrobium sp.]
MKRNLVRPAVAAIVGVVVFGFGLATQAQGQPKPENKDTPEEIAKDAARDLKDNRFYNKPGATRAQYDADWQECRFIARGSKLINGNQTFYNPALYNPSISPLAAGIGGGLGAAIGAAIAEGIQRRENRKRCLMIKGWRMVKLPAAKANVVSAMSDADKQAYFNRIVGAQTVEGEIDELTRFGPPQDPALAINPALAGPATLFIHKDPAKAILPALAPDQGALVVAFRRNGGAAAGRSGALQLFRYNRAEGDLFYQPRDWKKKGDKTTYVVGVSSGDKKAAYELRIIPVTAGDYVLNGASVGPNVPLTTSNCFGAPMIRVEAGQYAYLADASPFMGERLADGKKHHGMIFSRNFAVAKQAMTKLRPEVATKMVEPALHNRATYSCAAVTMDRFDFPGASELPTLASKS